MISGRGGNKCSEWLNCVVFLQSCNNPLSWTVYIQMTNYWFYIFEPRNEEIDPKKISHFKTQLVRLMQLRKESRSGAFSCNIKERLPTFRLFDTLPLSPDRRLEFLLLLFFNKVSNSERFSQGFFWVLAFKIPQRMPKKAKPRIVFLFGEPFFGLRQSRLFGFSW